MGTTTSLEQEFAGVDKGARYMTRPSSPHILLLPSPDLLHVLWDVADSVVYRDRWKKRSDVRPFIYTSHRLLEMDDVVVSYDPMGDILNTLHERLHCLPEDFISLHSLARDHMKGYCDVSPREFRDAAASFNDLTWKIVSVINSPSIPTNRLRSAGTGMILHAHLHHEPYGGVYQTIHVVNILNDCLIVQRMITDTEQFTGRVMVGYWPADGVRQQQALLERCDYRVVKKM